MGGRGLLGGGPGEGGMADGLDWREAERSKVLLEEAIATVWNFFFSLRKRLIDCKEERDCSRLQLRNT